MTEGSLAHLEEFLDTIVALPHDVQRILTLLREQEAVTHERESKLHETLRSFLGDDINTKESKNVASQLQEIKSQLMNVIGASDEKVNLAEHLHKTVQGHVKHLENEILCFEEEVRLARKYGELDEDIDDDDDDEKDLVEEEDIQDSGKVVESKKISNKKRKSATNSVSDDGSIPPVAESIAEFDIIPPPSTTSKRGRLFSSDEQSRQNITSPKSPKNDPNIEGGGVEATYCYCNQVSFGEMIGCDNDECESEWFHYSCVGLNAPPEGKWYCPDCTARMAKTFPDPLRKSNPNSILNETSSSQQQQQQQRVGSRRQQ